MFAARRKVRVDLGVPGEIILSRDKGRELREFFRLQAFHCFLDLSQTHDPNLVLAPDPDKRERRVFCMLKLRTKLRRRDADDASEDLRESARTGVADFERDFDQAALAWP